MQRLLDGEVDPDRAGQLLHKLQMASLPKNKTAESRSPPRVNQTRLIKTRMIKKR
jgi:hypothetical protein